jgi:hypothetical protein
MIVPRFPPSCSYLNTLPTCQNDNPTNQILQIRIIFDAFSPLSRVEPWKTNSGKPPETEIDSIPGRSRCSRLQIINIMWRVFTPVKGETL